MAKTKELAGVDEEPTEEETTETHPAHDPDMEPLVEMGKVLRIIHGMDKFAPPTPEEIQQEMIRRKLAATSPDELLAGADALPLEQFFGLPIMIRDYHIVQSGEQYDQAVFFVLDITYRGRAESVTTGALDVMESVAIAKAKGFLPMMAVADKATTATAKGFFPVKLRPFRDGDEPF